MGGQIAFLHRFINENFPLFSLGKSIHPTLGYQSKCSVVKKTISSLSSARYFSADSRASDKSKAVDYLFDSCLQRADFTLSYAICQVTLLSLTYFISSFLVSICL